MFIDAYIGNIYLYEKKMPCERRNPAFTGCYRRRVYYYYKYFIIIAASYLPNVRLVIIKLNNN